MDVKEKVIKHHKDTVEDSFNSINYALSEIRLNCKEIEKKLSEIKSWEEHIINCAKRIQDRTKKIEELKR